MKLLAELNDANLLGMEGMSSATPRRTARAVLQRADGLFAVMYVGRFGIHILPGGGMDEGESVEDTLRREIAEETGCVCREITPLGVVSENRAHADYTVLSYYFYVRTDGPGAAPQLTPEEQHNGSQLQWHPLETLVHLIGDPVHEVWQRVFLQARDMAALREYMSVAGIGEADVGSASAG